MRSVFGNTGHPAPKDVTDPVDVRVEAVVLRNAALAADILFAVVIATLLAAGWCAGAPEGRPAAAAAAPPYLVARGALEALAHGDLLSRGHTKDYYDAISDVIRRYLGGMRGFDAIEMTSDEVIAQVRKNPLPGVPLVEVERLLSECDLVKFAGYVPSHEDADEILRSAVSLVERGRPHVLPADGAKPAAGGAP